MPPIPQTQKRPQAIGLPGAHLRLCAFFTCHRRRNARRSPIPIPPWGER